jgi:hypothetical protein
MTNRNRNGLNITLISLSNTFENCLKWHEQGILNWRRNKGLLVERIERERQRGRRSFDRAEFDCANELWFYWEGKLAAYELLLDLYVAVASNPFPGERMRLLEVAYRLFPRVEGSFCPGGRLRGRGYWRVIFKEFELCGNVLIYFPAKDDDVDLNEVEKKLLELAAGNEFVYVKETKDILVWYPRSKTYRSVKKELENRGWKWGQKKVKGRLDRVIFIP